MLGGQLSICTVAAKTDPYDSKGWWKQGRPDKVGIGGIWSVGLLLVEADRSIVFVLVQKLLFSMMVGKSVFRVLQMGQNTTIEQ